MFDAISSLVDGIQSYTAKQDAVDAAIIDLVIGILQELYTQISGMISE